MNQNKGQSIGSSMWKDAEQDDQTMNCVGFQATCVPFKVHRGERLHAKKDKSYLG